MPKPEHSTRPFFKFCFFAILLSLVVLGFSGFSSAGLGSAELSTSNLKDSTYAALTNATRFCAKKAKSKASKKGLSKGTKSYRRFVKKKKASCISKQDSDDDNVRDKFDNCPNDSNEDQADTDNDGTGDVCDSDTETDITDAILTRSSADCSDYVGTYVSSITETSSNDMFNGSLVITHSNGKCIFATNSIPNHDVDGSDFATSLAAVTNEYEISDSPTEANSSTALSLETDNAIMLNGAKIDLLAAACYGVGSEPLGEERIGCMTVNTPWRYDPVFAGNDFGTDANNAHTQPDGAYHYHGDPKVLYDTSGGVASPVIGFAADGFPIYGPYINDGGSIRKAVSGYTLKSGARVSQTGEGAFPGGNYDGTFIDDYEFTDAGDLDECNGMMYNGSYAYFVTDSYPYDMKCFKGTPDSSFNK